MSCVHFSHAYVHTQFLQYACFTYMENVLLLCVGCSCVYVFMMCWGHVRVRATLNCVFMSVACVCMYVCMYVCKCVCTYNK